jgi:hypothetical protein
MLLLLLQLAAASGVDSSVSGSTSTASVVATRYDAASDTVPESSGNAQSSLPEAQTHRQLFWSLVFLGRLSEAVVSLAVGYDWGLICRTSPSKFPLC